MMTLIGLDGLKENNKKEDSMTYYLVYRQFSEISDYADKFKTCRCETKERLSEIQVFLNKDIEVMKTSKADYALAIKTTAAVDDIQALIDNFENRVKRKKKKPKKK